MCNDNRLETFSSWCWGILKKVNYWKVILVCVFGNISFNRDRLLNCFDHCFPKWQQGPAEFRPAEGWAWLCSTINWHCATLTFAGLLMDVFQGSHFQCYTRVLLKEVVKNLIFLTVTCSRRLAAFFFSSSVLGSFTFISSSSFSCFKMLSIYSWWNNEKEEERCRCRLKIDIYIDIIIPIATEKKHISFPTSL